MRNFDIIRYAADVGFTWRGMNEGCASAQNYAKETNYARTDVCKPASSPRDSTFFRVNSFGCEFVLKQRQSGDIM